MFESPLRLALGLLTGVAFGFFLQKGRVAKHGGDLGKVTLPAATTSAAAPWVGALTASTALGAGAIELAQHR